MFAKVTRFGDLVTRLATEIETTDDPPKRNVGDDGALWFECV